MAAPQPANGLPGAGTGDPMTRPAVALSTDEQAKGSPVAAPAGPQWQHTQGFATYFLAALYGAFVSVVFWLATSRADLSIVAGLGSGAYLVITSDAFKVDAPAETDTEDHDFKESNR